MGMFDYIDCEYPLPETPSPCPKGTRFQTKDTPGQYLYLYTITEDGRLLWHPKEGEPEFCRFSGELEFYGYVPDTRGEWVYKSWFRDGYLKDIFVYRFRDHYQHLRSQTKDEDNG